MVKTKKKKAYFVSDHEEYGIFVVAHSVKHAKILGWGDESLCNDEWTDLKAKWKKGINVEDLNLGVQDDLREGLRRGVFGFVEECDEGCDVCGKSGKLYSYDGKAVCFECQGEEWQS